MSFGLVLGIGCYYWLFKQKLTVRFVKLLIETVRFLVVRLVVKAFELLVILPIKVMYRVTMFILAFFRVFTMFLFKIVVQLLRPFWLLVSWMTRPL